MANSRSATDWVLEGLSIVLLLATFAFVLLEWPEMPERVPRHFNASGQPDGWGGKSFVWFLPVTSVFLYLLMTAAGRYPQLINIPLNVDRNDPNVRQILLSFCIVMKAVILVSFLYITVTTVETAMGRTGGLGSLFLPLFLLATAAPLVFYLRKLRRLPKS